MELSSSTTETSHSPQAYTLLELIGTGSFGDVWRAVDVTTQQEVAIKIVDLEDIGDGITDVQQEISLLRRCHSPNIVQYYGATLLPGTARLQIAMEYMAASAADLLSPKLGGGALPEQHVAYILREVLNALVYLHSEHQMHRDIKASNILLSLDGEVKVGDFGVAAQLGAAVGVKRRTFIGSPLWMAPEVIQQSPDLAGLEEDNEVFEHASGGGRGAGGGGEAADGYDEAADVWSLGITAMELALGQPPRSGIPAFRLLFIIVKEPPPRLDASFSEPFRDFVAQCLQQDPSQRPSAIDLLMHPFVVQAELPEDFVQQRVRDVADCRRQLERREPSTVVAPLNADAMSAFTAGGGEEEQGENENDHAADTVQWDFGTVQSSNAPASRSKEPEKEHPASHAPRPLLPPPPVEIPSEMENLGIHGRNDAAPLTKSSAAGSSASHQTVPAVSPNTGPLKLVVQPALSRAMEHEGINNTARCAASSAAAALEDVETSAPGSTRQLLLEMAALLGASSDGSLAELRSALEKSFVRRQTQRPTAVVTGQPSVVGVDVSKKRDAVDAKNVDLGPLGNFLVRQWQESGRTSGARMPGGQSHR